MEQLEHDEEIEFETVDLEVDRFVIEKLRPDELSDLVALEAVGLA